MDKIRSSGSDSVWVGRIVEIYDQVFPGIFFTLGYFRVCRVFSGISGYLRVYTGILDIISFLVVVSKILRFDGSSGDLEDIHAHI